MDDMRRSVADISPIPASSGTNQSPHSERYHRVRSSDGLNGGARLQEGFCLGIDIDVWITVSYHWSRPIRYIMCIMHKIFTTTDIGWEFRDGAEMLRALLPNIW